MDASRPRLPTWVRLLIFGGLLVVVWFALPVSATIVESVSSTAENWITVLFFALALAVGAAVGALVPRASTATTRGGAAVRWAGAGVVAAVIAYVVWVFALAG